MDTSRWLSLIVSLPGKNQALRMRVWRQIKASGAAVLRDGAYLLPDRPHLKDGFQKIAAEIIAHEGVAHMFCFASEDNAQQQLFEELFVRSESYVALLKKISEARRAIVEQGETEARKAQAALLNELTLIQRIDFFPQSEQDQVADAMKELELAILARFSPDEPDSIATHISQRDIAQYQSRYWATRKRMWIDRVASAWLIRRYIDKQASFIWLDNPDDCPADALGFDFNGAEFTHIGDKVSFEVLLHSFGLATHAGLSRLAEIVHYLDVGGIPVAEAKGLEMILLGARESCADDDALLTEMSKIFDHLVKAFSQSH